MSRNSPSTFIKGSRATERISMSILADAAIVLMDVPPSITPTLNDVLGLVGTLISAMPAIILPSA